MVREATEEVELWLVEPEDTASSKPGDPARRYIGGKPMEGLALILSWNQMLKDWTSFITPRHLRASNLVRIEGRIAGTA